jgi:hypothetical protein
LVAIKISRAARPRHRSPQTALNDLSLAVERTGAYRFPEQMVLDAGIETARSYLSGVQETPVRFTWLQISHQD